MTKPQWAADIDIDTALAARLIAAQFPHLQGRAVEPFGVGWDNAAFLVDGRIVFRFPRRRDWAGLIAREVAVLPRIAAQVPLAVPAPSFVGAPSGEYPYLFAGYERIAGETACSLPLSDEARGALAAPLARFLRALHAVPSEPLVAVGLTGDEIGRLDGEKRLRLTRERIHALPGEALSGAGEACLAWLEAHPPVALAAGARSLVHGDLYARHLLLDPAARLAGIIEGGDVHLGDPAIDISIAHLVLPATAHGAFRDAYGPIDARTWELARYRAIYHAVLELDYGLRENDTGMRESGLAALRLMRAAGG
jgi:aminoglycoside phosphotransferase (APT) family kinase protein